MKMLSFLAAATLLLGTAAQAQWSDPYGDTYCGYNGCYDRSYDRGYDRGYGRADEGVAVGVACAPEVLQGNVVATDRTLAKLAATPAFASATTFKSQLKHISAVKSPAARAKAYFKLIGINPANKDQVVEFIGEREVKASQLAELERSTQLSPAQADKVASSLQKTLRGDLR